MTAEPRRSSPDWVVKHLRSSRRPAKIVYRQELPVTDTGKVLRRVLKAELSRAIRSPDAPRRVRAGP